MKKIYTLLTAIAFLAIGINLTNAQCTGGRYHDMVFPGNPTVTSDVVYGSNLDQNNATVSLKLDVYRPACDNATNRPLIVFAHGGSFVSGDKADAGYAATCISLAKLGYVVASINYRLGFPTSGLAAQYGFNSAIVRGVHDARAAIRFMRDNALNGGNTYGIDPNNIFFAGVSAGGIIALHLAYQNTSTEMNAMACGGQPGTNQGSVEGLSNALTASSSVKAIVSISGGIRDLNWILANDIPVYMAHGTADGTVPYGSGTFGGFFTVHGSSSIRTRCNSTNPVTKNCLIPMIGQDHTPTNVAYVDTVATTIRNFLEHMYCNVTLNCNYTTSPVATVPAVSIAITSGTNPTCAGSSVTFTATATGGGATPTYQWKKNGTNVGTNSTYSSASLANGDVITCVMTPTGGCGTAATSNAITMTINAASAPTVAIAITSGSNPTCAGASLTFTATPTNGGAALSYQWKKNGSNIGTGSTYTSSTLVNGDVISCVLTSNSSCANPTTATSNSVTMTVTALPTVTQSGNVLTSSTGSSYQWYKNGQLISGATAQTYTATTTGSYSVTTGAGNCQSNPVNVVVSGIFEQAGNDNLFSVSPNPNDGNFTLSFSISVKATYKLELRNVLGATVYSEALNNFAGAYSKQIDISELAKGVYIISLSDSQNTFVGKVVVN